MRAEHELVVRLIWDAKARRDFGDNQARFLRREYPTVNLTVAAGFQLGIEEDAYRVLASISRVLEGASPLLHCVANAFGGRDFLEFTAAHYWDSDWGAGLAARDLFEPVLAVRAVEECARRFDWPDASSSWIRVFAEYEVLRFVAANDPSVAITGTPGLVSGTRLFYAPFDLKGLRADVERLRLAKVPEDVIRTRLSPVSGEYACAIQRADGGAAEIALPGEVFRSLKDHIENGSPIVSSIREPLVSARILLEDVRR